MSRARLLLACSVIGAPVAAQSATGRWSLQVRGPVTVDRGDLRIDGDSGRLLLESRDTAWLPVWVQRADADRIVLVVVGGERLAGTLRGNVMSGALSSGDAPAARWEAHRIQPGTEHWPVRPRVVVRQLVIGRDDSMAVFSDAWRSRTLSHPALLAEHAELAAVVGLPPGSIATIADRAQRLVLGLDPTGRGVARRQLEAIARTPAADHEFTTLFRTPAGGWRLDLHDAAWQFAAAQLPAAAYSRDSLAPILARVGALTSRDPDDSDLVRAVWRVWSRHRSDPDLLADVLGPGANAREPGQRGLRVLMAGYDVAEAWWLRAVDWLLTHRWIAVGDTFTSPVDLVATFWERDSIGPPEVESRHFGSMQAVPVIGVAGLGRQLLVPGNAIATEFLDSRQGRRDAMQAWRALDFADRSPMRITMGPQSMVLSSPAVLTRGRLGGFLAAESAIRIEPGIMPIFAVGTVVHEWQHLLFEAARLEGPGTPGLRRAEWGVHLVEADPWLGEGAAEWATEQVLAPARGSTPLFALVEAEKRLAIGAGQPDDTHVLGYLLVRAAANRVDGPAALRRLLVTSLHDPVALAVAIGLAGPSTNRIPRPPTLVVIPEVTFVVDGGMADDLTRRLIFPALPVEP